MNTTMNQFFSRARSLSKEDDDTDRLAARVQALERKRLPEAIRLIADGRVQIEAGCARILPSRSKSTLPS